jgi:hypothetical protein
MWQIDVAERTATADRSIFGLLLVEERGERNKDGHQARDPHFPHFVVPLPRRHLVLRLPF